MQVGWDPSKEQCPELHLYEQHVWGWIYVNGSELKKFALNGEMSAGCVKKQIQHTQDIHSLFGVTRSNISNRAKWSHEGCYQLDKSS